MLLVQYYTCKCISIVVCPENTQVLHNTMKHHTNFNSINFFIILLIAFMCEYVHVRVLFVCACISGYTLYVICLCVRHVSNCVCVCCVGQLKGGTDWKTDWKTDWLSFIFSTNIALCLLQEY